MRSLCVFCGSRVGNQPIYIEAARELGAGMARWGLELVFGGGHIGLMGVLADAVLQAGGEVTGVIPQELVDRELAHARVTRLHVVQTMHQRKALMADLSDGFAALPGGFGTADEMFEILTWAQLGIHAKPVGLLNVAGFFTPLLDWLDRGVETGFLKSVHRRLLMEAQTPEELLELLLHYRPVELPVKGVEPQSR